MLYFRFALSFQIPVRRKRESIVSSVSFPLKGWSGGKVMLGQLPVLGRPANLDNSRRGSSALAVGAGLGWGRLSVFQFSLLPPPPPLSLWETAQ